MALSRCPTVEFLYKCSDVYVPEEERGIAWNDPQIGIDWQLDAAPVLSDRDRKHPMLAEIAPEELPLYRQEAPPALAGPQERIR